MAKRHHGFGLRVKHAVTCLNCFLNDLRYDNQQLYSVPPYGPVYLPNNFRNIRDGNGGGHRRHRSAGESDLCLLRAVPLDSIHRTICILINCRSIEFESSYPFRPHTNDATTESAITPATVPSATAVGTL